MNVQWFVLKNFLLSMSSCEGEHILSAPALLEHPCLWGEQDEALPKALTDG